MFYFLESINIRGKSSEVVCRITLSQLNSHQSPPSEERLNGQKAFSIEVSSTENTITRKTCRACDLRGRRIRSI